MIHIIDYGVGNLVSIRNMILKSGHSAEIVDSEKFIRDSSKLIFPGMGNFDNCMQKFEASGLREAVVNKVFNEKIPVLGICVGLQMMMESSEEGSEKGLGWLKGKTVRFDRARMNESLRIPNVGWLDVKKQKDSALLDGLIEPRFYFAHSFHVQLDNVNDSLLTADYGYQFTAAIERGNILGVQFHPEKSHRYGMKLLGNFSSYY
jgi:glutamine amidotransferase